MSTRGGDQGSSSISGGGERTDGDIPPQRSGQPGPDTPLELSSPDWKASLKRSLKEVKDDRITLVAAGMAYYWFLAIFPGLIAVVGLLGLVDISPSELAGVRESIQSTLPSGAARLVLNALTRAGNASEGAALTATILGTLVALWSASSGMVALQSGLNIAYDVDKDRKFIAKRLVALLLIVVMGLLGGVPSPFFTFGESTIFTVIGFILTAIAVVLMFSIFYYVGPKRSSPDWKWVSPGGILGAVLWVVSSLAFGWFVESGFASYEKTYGGLGSVVVLILWLFISALSVLVGGEVNAEIERQSARRSGQAA
jgi:membrane protein